MAYLNKINKPKIAIIDCDFPIYYSASAAEQIYYVYYDQDYNEVRRFKSADEGKGWIEEFNLFGGIDLYGSFNGDPSTLIRETEWEPKDFKIATQTIDGMLEEWLELAQCGKWQGKCAAQKGADVFREHVCTLKEYKGNRKNTRKPHHLEPLRKWALKEYSQLSKVIGPYEADDIVCAKAQKLGDKAVVVEEDKDCRIVRGCWFLIPSCMDEPEYSPLDSVGYVYLDKSGSSAKVKGYGWLYLLSMCLTGDSADNYDGCPGVGPTKAVKVLEVFNSKHDSVLKQVVEATGEVFKHKLGDKVSYNHWSTGEEIEASWKDVFIENLILAYMIKGKNDRPQKIIDIIEEM